MSVSYFTRSQNVDNIHKCIIIAQIWVAQYVTSTYKRIKWKNYNFANTMKDCCTKTAMKYRRQDNTTE